MEWFLDSPCVFSIVNFDGPCTPTQESGGGTRVMGLRAMTAVASTVKLRDGEGKGRERILPGEMGKKVTWLIEHSGTVVTWGDIEKRFRNY